MKNAKKTTKTNHLGEASFLCAKIAVTGEAITSYADELQERYGVGSQPSAKQQAEIEEIQKALSELNERLAKIHKA